MFQKIKLHGGPWNGRSLDDSGLVTIRMAIAEKWQGQRPVIGTRVGVATYEPNPERTAAFWLENQWDGHLALITDFEGF